MDEIFGEIGRSMVMKDKEKEGAKRMASFNNKRTIDDK